MMKSNIFNDNDMESVEVAANLARDAETGDDQGLEDIDIDYGADDNVTTSTKKTRSSTSTKVMGCMFLGGVACGATAGFAYGGVEANKAGMIQSRMSTAACSKAPKSKGSKGPKSSGSPGPVNHSCSEMVGHVFEDAPHDLWIEIIEEQSLGWATPYGMCGYKLDLIMGTNTYPMAGLVTGDRRNQVLSFQGWRNTELCAGVVELNKKLEYNIAISTAGNVYDDYMYGWFGK